MLTSAYSNECGQCSGKVLDAGEEFVCSSCGTVLAKEIIEPQQGRTPQAVDYTNHSLGSFLGPLEYGYEETFASGFSKSSSSFRYLKTLSDFSNREDASIYGCAKLMERVCEKLALPKTIIGEAINIALGVLEMRRNERNDITIAAVSAFAIIGACKIRGFTHIGVKEVIEMHRNLGYRVKISTMIRISIEAPTKVKARRGEDYLATVIARLPQVLEGKEVHPAYQNRLQEMAKKIFGLIDGPARGGHNPRGLAATAVYAAEITLAKMEKRRKLFCQREIAGCAEVAEYTIREQFVEIFKPRLSAIRELVAAVVTTRNLKESTQTCQTPHQSRPLLS